MTPMTMNMDIKKWSMYDEKQYKEYGDNYYYYDKVLGWAGHVCDTPPQ